MRGLRSSGAFERKGISNQEIFTNSRAPLVAVRSRRGGGAFEQIGISNQEIFTDSRAPLVAGQPETREYQVQAYQNNQTVGPRSPIVAVVTLP